VHLVGIGAEPEAVRGDDGVLRDHGDDPDTLLELYTCVASMPVVRTIVSRAVDENVRRVVRLTGDGTPNALPERQALNAAASSIPASPTRPACRRRCRPRRDNSRARARPLGCRGRIGATRPRGTAGGTTAHDRGWRAAIASDRSAHAASATSTSDR